MRTVISIIVSFAISGWVGCASVQKVMVTPERETVARPAMDELRAGNFDAAMQAAKAVLEVDPENPQARLVSAISRYQGAMHNFYRDMAAVIGGVFVGREINHRMLKWAIENAEKELALVEKDLGISSKASNITLDLCLACWERDWNHDGRVDDRDALLFQIEVDAEGNRIPEGDPRRKPTFHFDVGDVFWARAMVDFQRAALNLALAYKVPEMSELMDVERAHSMTIKLADKKRVHEAKKLILAGIENADRARREYLAETDDVSEWVPNPEQKNHPLPLPVDEKLYATWKGVLRDLRELLKGTEGLGVAEMAQLGDHQWQDPPQGYVNIAKLMDEPGDIVINLDNADALENDRSRANVERVLEDILGEKYCSNMKPTPLIGRLSRMKREMEKGQESLGRKLRYLLWLN